MSLKSLNQPLTRRGAIRAVLVLACAALAGTGAWWGWRAWQERPRSATAGKAAIRDYLLEQSGQRRFAALAANTTTNAEPAAASAEDRPKKEKRKKQPPATDHRRPFRERVKEAADYKSVYRVLGEGLALADQLLETKSAEDTESALFLAAEASQAAHDVAVNDWLAARIAEAYLWPGLAFANSSEARRVSGDYLLNVADDAFRAAGETNNLVQNCRLAITHASRPGRADNARFRLARVLEDQGDLTGALAVLREITETNNPALQRRTASVEQQLKAKQAAN